DGQAVDVDDQVVGLQAGLFGGGARDDVVDVGRGPLDDVGDQDDAVVAAAALLLALVGVDGPVHLLLLDEVGDLDDLLLAVLGDGLDLGVDGDGVVDPGLGQLVAQLPADDA